MTTLLEIGGDVQSLLALLAESDGEITPENEQAINQWFAEIGDAQERKLDGYVALIKEYTLRAAARREEMERLARRVQVDENTAKRLKDWLKLYLEMTGQQHVETRRYKVSLCGNGGKAAVDLDCAPQDLPPSYQIHVIKPDLDGIRECLESGHRIAGARLLPRGTHLRIS